ncbi:protein kinase regulating ubiquinone biosynthesis [Haloferula helveola]|uniref:Protein kinase regulating ubiquinone biosynthesis n=1 Tax=Haloferula helveola TaxID=490095 RepID=A0ABM7RJM3_9BACT|nr:protein kinase regulating ubiquinone biosynthesis [Haloferula helveola]
MDSHTLERAATYKDVGKLLLKYLPKISRDRDQVAQHLGFDDDIAPSESAEEFASDLEKLGPTFVKLGQLLSTRSDLLPPEWTTALQRLQDDVEPVPFDAIRERIETELGAKIERLFDHFEERPIACASLGQVHRATLRSGGPEVVVKIQRPGIRERVVSELDAIQNIADFLCEHTKMGRTYDIDLMVTQFRKAIVGELNYQAEAENLVRLAKNLKAIDAIVVPSPIRDYCSMGVLTMDCIHGTKVTEVAGVVKTELDGEALAEKLFEAYLQQILVDGFFHADPHPGNVMLTRDRQLALIDLGMVGTVSDGTRDLLIQLLGAVADGKGTDATKVALRLGRAKEGFDPASFKEEMEELVESRQSTSIEDLQVGTMVMSITEICGRNGLRIPSSLFMIGKMLLNLDMIGKHLAPQFNPDASLRRHLSELSRKNLDQEFSLGSLLSHFSDMKEMLLETPSRINRTLEMVAQNELKIQVDAIDEKQLLLGFHRVANRITVGLILAALIVGASMLMGIESSFTLMGYPGLAIIFFLIAAIGGLIVVGRILFGNEKGG